MKLKTTKKEVREGYYRILSIGYCDAQYLLSEEKPFGYSKGVYGWVCDYYDIDGVCISTGYSPLSDKNMRYNYDLVKEYEKKAKESERKDRPAMIRELVKKLNID